MATPIQFSPQDVELTYPKPIPPYIRFEVLKLLRRFHREVGLSLQALSEASGTSAPVHSEASTGTSLTEMTFTFSTGNGSIQREAARKPLPDVQRARKALLRKLQTCQDCHHRKVKCQLWHHALRDLLEIEHTSHDEVVIEWAIRYDVESQTPITTPPVSARVTEFAAGDDIEERNDVVDQANGVFGLSDRPPMPYGSGIHETTASLLGDSESPPSLPPSLPREDTVVPAVPPPYIYNTAKDQRMFPLGSRGNIYGSAQYRCEYPRCAVVLRRQDLTSHFELHHFRFEHLDDPLRMVCPVCDKFYVSSTDQCLACLSDSLTEKLYGRYFPSVSITGLQPESGAVHSGMSYFVSSGAHGQGCFPYQSYGSFQGNNGSGYNDNFQYGSSGGMGGRYWSNTRVAVAQVKRSLFSLPIRILRFFPSLVRRHKYIAVLVIAATVSLVLGYKKHNWIVSNLVQLTHGVPTVSPSKLPVIGVVVASVAFGLHRIIVHVTRANGIRSGWLSRCALNVFNMACGRRPPEWSGTTGYELGHSRS